MAMSLCRKGDRDSTNDTEMNEKASVPIAPKKWMREDQEGQSIFRSGNPSCRWEPLTRVLASQFFESRKYEENHVSKICTTEIIGAST